MAKTTLKTEQVKIRRSPKYFPFMLTGAILGLIVALILDANITPEARSAAAILGYLIAFSVAIGAGLGITLAVILDRIGSARSKTLEATKLEG
jgi:H+/Cl- antiporter ClcA